MAVVAFYVFLSGDHSSRSSFIIGKARVSPLKQQTIPRLELQAAVYAIRMRRTIINETTFNIVDVHHWSDSSSVLHWISNTHERHKIFIANRLSEILDHSQRSEWRYVPSKLNPADNATRGLPASEIQSNSDWLRGPSFLNNKDQWPEMPFSYSSKDNIWTEASFSIITMTTHTKFINYSRFSKWSRLLNVVIACLKFTNKLRRIRITHTEAQLKATSLLFKISQGESFANEIISLGRNQPISPKSRIINFSPFLSSERMLLSASRIQHAPVAFATANPIILDAAHEIVRLFLEDQHASKGHLGAEHLRNDLLQEFWILKLRTTLKSIIHRCFVCRRQRQLHSQPRMGNLPTYRFSLRPAVFKNFGLDNFGPFGLSITKSKVEQFYCLIFTCLVTRAVHIELCERTTCTSTLLAIKRFISRRGLPDLLVSDNASNFQRCAALLDKNVKPTNEEEQALERMPSLKWKFNPPGAPHYGGCWKRLIGLAKRIFFIIANSQYLSRELFTSLMCEIEQLLNSRPLTPVSLSIHDVESLTPNHFLRPAHQGCETQDLITLHRKKQSLLDQFWKRLMKEYVPTLRPRRKWQNSVDVLKEDDLVWILEHNTPRGMWPIGLITKALPSNDGVNRSFELRCQKGKFIKPAKKLAPILPWPLNGTHVEDLNILRGYYFRLSFALQNGGDDILEIDLIDFLDFDA